MGLRKTKNNIDNEKRIVDYRNLGKCGLKVWGICYWNNDIRKKY